MLVWIILAQRTRSICACILGGIGLFAFLIGLDDIAGVQSFSARLLALFFLIVGGYLLVSAVGLIRRTSWGPSSALVGSILGAIIGLTLVIVQIVGFENDYRVLLWLIIVLASLLCTRALLKAGADTGVLKRIPTLLTAVGIAGLLPFWYTELYVPSAPEPTLAITNELAREGITIIDKAKGTRMLAIKATVTLRNGNSQLRYISEMHRVVGQDIIPDPKGLDSPKLRSSLKKEGTTLSYGRYGESKLIAARTFFYTGNWLGPGEEVKRTFVFYVPEGTFDIVHFTTRIWTGNGHRFDIGEPCHDKPYPTNATTIETKAWEIEESSSLANLTRNKRCMFSSLSDDSDEGLSRLGLRLAIDKAKFPPPEFSVRALARVYGVFGTTSTTELSLWDEEDSKITGRKGTAAQGLSETS